MTVTTEVVERAAQALAEVAGLTDHEVWPPLLVGGAFSAFRVTATVEDEGDQEQWLDRFATDTLVHAAGFRWCITGTQQICDFDAPPEKRMRFEVELELVEHP